MDDSTLDAFADWERKSWELRAQAYADLIGVLTCPAVRTLLDAGRVAAGTRVLDVATGPGFVAGAAAERGATVTAIDQSAAMVSIARSRLPELDVRQASVEELGLPDSSYDAVVGGFVLNHLARPEKGVAELARVLAPGGWLALSVWDLPTVNRVTGLLAEVVAEVGIRGVLPAGPDATRFADHGILTDLLIGADLHEVQVYGVRWFVDVEPGAWFDAVGRGMPRSGAVLAQADETQYAEARQMYVARCLADHGDGSGLVRLPAAGVIGCGRRT